MTAFTRHKLQQDFLIITGVPIYLDETKKERIFTVFRLVALIVHNFGTPNFHGPEDELSGTYQNDKITLPSTIRGTDYTPYASQSVSIANMDGKVIFKAHYFINENIVSSPTLIIDVNHLDPFFDDNVPDLPNHYRDVTHALYELWRHLLETHPAARTPAYDYKPPLIPSEFF